MTHDPTDIQGQEASRQHQDERTKRERQVEVEDLKWLMKNKQGRRVAWRWLEDAGVFRSSMTGNSYTFFNEGQRNVGLKLLAVLHQHCAEQYALMVAESRDVKGPKE